MADKTLVLTTALALLAATPAFAANASDKAQPDQTKSAQQSDQSKAGSGEEPAAVALSSWNYNALYSDGWSAEQVLNDTAVLDKDGNEIGSVENILVDSDGKILSLIVEVGGFAGIGSTDLSVPWDQVGTGSNMEEITVPVNEDNLDKYSIFGDWGSYTKASMDKTQVVEEDVNTGPHVWKASDVVNDYAVLDDGTGYGYVDDLIFDKSGDVMAIVVSPDLAYGRTGPYAYPFYGYDYGFRPGYAYYPLNYGEDELVELDTFDYAKMQNSPSGAENGDQSADAQQTDPQTTGSTSDEEKTPTDQQ